MTPAFTISFYIYFIFIALRFLGLFGVHGSIDSESSIDSHHRHQNNKTVHHDRHHRPASLPHIDKIRRCGSHKHTSMTRPCALNDTECGAWDLKDRYWHPLACRYQDISAEEARKCLGNRTIAFIGDSQIRDIAVGVAMFLLGEKLQTSSDQKFDYKGNPGANGTLIPDFTEWKNNVPGHNHNGYIFPQKVVADEKGYQWQVQVWNLYCNNYVHGQIEDVLNNVMPSRWNQLKKIDLAFWNHGLHDYGWFDKPPYGKKFYETIFGQWLRLRRQVAAPSVWVSMNPECQPLISFKISHSDLQARMVEEINWYLNERTIEEKLPYWDAGAVLRSPQRCNVSADGVHVKMFVDIMRAKMLFNHLCDSEMNWRGSPEMFT